jgi:hypothetical protein
MIGFGFSPAAGLKKGQYNHERNYGFPFCLPQGGVGAEKRKGIDKNILPASRRLSAKNK